VLSGFNISFHCSQIEGLVGGPTEKRITPGPSGNSMGRAEFSLWNPIFSLDEILVTEQTQALAQRPIVAADLKEQSPSRIVVSALGLVSQTRIVS
jgi:hypothetical protein